MKDIEIRPNLFNLKQQLALLNKREYTWAEIAKTAGLNVRTVTDLAKANGSTRVDLRTLARLLVFFRREGMAVTIADLLVETDPAADAVSGE